MLSWHLWQWKNVQESFLGCDKFRESRYWDSRPTNGLLIRIPSDRKPRINFNPTQFNAILRNFNPRNFQFLDSFSFKNIFAPSPITTTLVSKDAEFSCASFHICQKFAASCPLPKRPRKNLKMNFRFSLPRKLVRVWFHFK